MREKVSLVSAGNTSNPCLLVLRSKGYELQFEQAEDGQSLFLARKDGCEFLGYSPVELLGLVTLWENLGVDWNQQEPDLLGFLLEGSSPLKVRSHP
jgi:hypothetical protein